MDLNDIKQLSVFDSGRVAESIVLLPDQIKDLLKQAKNLKLPASYSKIDSIVVFGMGGSNLGARIVASVFKEELTVPMIIEPGYVVPAFVGQKTLCLLSSYSGSTEETLSVYAELKKRKSKVAVISSLAVKNPLSDLMLRDKLPGLIFDPIANPSSQPRMALGYSVFAFVALLERVGVIKVSEEKKKKIIKDLSVWGAKLDIGVKNNPAKSIVSEIYGRQVFLVGADFLEGSLHALRNQFCENSKNTASYLVLPDMNHYALEGLAYPPDNKDNLVFIFFNTDLCGQRVAKRFSLTKQVVENNGIKVLEWKLKSKTKLGQASEMLQVGSWITFYLAFLNGVDPVKIPWVDWFKERLA